MDFLEKLDYLMNKYELTKTTLSQKSGIPYTTIDAWYKKGYEGLKLTTLRKLASYFNTSLDYLMLDEITDPNYGKSNGFQIDYNEMENLIKPYRSLDDHGKETVTIILDREARRTKHLADNAAEISSLQEQLRIQKRQAHLCLYSYLGKIACAGTGFYFDDIPTDTIEAPYVEGADFIIGVSGDSMEPNYHDGEKLYVQKAKELTLGDIGIFTIRNECFVKELGEHGLISKNPNYDDIWGNEDVRLIGRILGKIEED